MTKNTEKRLLRLAAVVLAVGISACAPSTSTTTAAAPTTPATTVAAAPTTDPAPTTEAVPATTAPAPATSAPVEVVATAAPSGDEAACTDYLSDLPSSGYIYLENDEVPAFEAAAAARLNGLADLASGDAVGGALRAEAEMWAAGEDFAEGPTVLDVCTEVLGEDRVNELLESAE